VLVLVRESIGTRDANGIGTKARQGVYGSLEEELGTGRPVRHHSGSHGRFGRDRVI
jgi:hypothetical protein